MRRPHKDKPTSILRTGDIKRDLSQGQLAAIGAVTLAFNVLEDELDLLMLVSVGIPVPLFNEISTRIHGIDGKISIVQKALAKSDLNQSDQKAANESVAEFGGFKKIRDCVDHARILNAAVGIGISSKKRGDNAFEILLTQEALDRCYDHMVALQKELESLRSLLTTVRTLTALGDSDDPNRSKYEEAVRDCRAQFHTNRSHRRSLKPLARFPDEDQLNAAVLRYREAQTAALMGWFQPLSAPPQQRRGLHPSLLSGPLGSPRPLLQSANKPKK